eukprot:gene8236-biopygen6116
MPAPRPRHARATQANKWPIAHVTPVPFPRHCPVTPGFGCEREVPGNRNWRIGDRWQTKRRGNEIHHDSIVAKTRNRLGPRRDRGGQRGSHQSPLRSPLPGGKSGRPQHNTRCKIALNRGGGQQRGRPYFFEPRLLLRPPRCTGPKV